MEAFTLAHVKDIVPPWLLPDVTAGDYAKTEGVNLRLILAWVMVWLLVHFVLWSVWNPMRCISLTFSPSPTDRYRRRLARGQVYCALASVGGCHLLFCRTGWSAQSLLSNYSLEHEVLFAMAAGHWAVGLWEDVANWRYLNAGLSNKDVFNTETPALDLQEYMGRAQLLHHWCAFWGYCLVLHTKACVGVCMFGLLFELPVLLMNHREFALNADRQPAWYRDERSLERFWQMLYLVFFFARVGPTLVYLYSLLYWFEDIFALPFFHAAIYHGMAWLFTLINSLLLFSFFPKWRNKDMERHDQGKRFKRKDARLELVSAEERKLINEDVQPVKVVPIHSLQRNDGSGKDGTLWVEIDAIVYDVTSFQKSHPGGDEVFLKYAGKDASEDFHRARHSLRAKRLMQEYMVGPLKRTTTRYRIFEHEDELKETHFEIFQAMAVYLLTIFLIYCTGFHQAQATRHGASLMTLSVPGGVLMLIASGTVFIARALCGKCQCVYIHPKVHMLALSLNVFATSLVIVRQPLPAAAGANCPTGLELAMSFMLIIEELREVLRGGKGVLTSKALIVLIFVLGSWHMRDAQKLIEVAPEQLYAGAGLALSITHIARYVHFQQSDRVLVANFIMSGFVMAGPWSVACLAYSSAHDAQAEEALQALRATLHQSWWTLCIVFGAANMVTATIIALLNNAWVMSQAWATRSMALYFFLGILIANGMSSWRWLFLIGIILHLCCLNGRLRKHLENGDFTQELREAPFRIGTQAIFDQAAVGLCMVCWRTAEPVLRGFMRLLLPEELTVYACDIPIFELGEGVDLGIAAYYAPPRRRLDPQTILDPSLEDGGLAAEETASHFLCNVGHIDVTHEAGLQDLQRTMNTSRDAWHEFSTENVRGFLANVVSFFPNIQTSAGNSVAKEINISVWASEEDAHDWQAASNGHRNITKQHASGTLRTFGNLVSSLKPVGPVRYQDRCQRCCRLVESAELGEPPPLRCTSCGGKTFDYPLF